MGHNDRIRTQEGVRRSSQSDFDLCVLVIFFAILEFLTGSAFHKRSIRFSDWSAYEKTALFHSMSG